MPTVQYAIAAAAPTPARRSVAENSGYWDSLDDEARAAIETVIERPSQLVPISRTDDALVSAIYEAYTAVVFEDRPATLALQEAQIRLEQNRLKQPWRLQRLQQINLLLSQHRFQVSFQLEQHK